MVQEDAHSAGGRGALSRSGVLRKPIRWLVLAAILTFVALTFTDALTSAWQRLSEQPIDPSWHLLAALVLFVLAVPLSGILWGGLLRSLDHGSVEGKAAAIAHVKSWLLKYIPGQIGSLAYKIYWGSQNGIRAGRIAVSYFYENAFLQIASIVPAVAILVLFGRLDGDAPRLVVGLSIVAGLGILAVTVSLPDNKLGLAMLRKVGGVEQENPRLLSGPKCLRHSLFFIGPRLLNGAGFVLIAANLTQVGSADWLVLGSAYVLAGAIGILAIFVPSGLGVREAVIVILVSPVLGTEVAILSALLARFISLVADGLLFAGALMTGLLRNDDTR